MEKWLKSKKYRSIHAEYSKKAVEFYKKCGYTKMPFDDPDGYESSPEDIPMGKRL